MKSLSLPVDHSLNRSTQEHFLSVGNADGLVVYSCIGYGSESKFRAKAQADIVAILGQHRDTERHGYGGRLFVCADGTIIMVGWVHAAGWRHTITGPDRKHSSATMGNWTTRDDAESSARGHAAQSYGGIVGDYPL
jgi:hypothetical protein